MVPARVVGITRAPSVLEDGGMLKARCTDERQALQQAEAVLAAATRLDEDLLARLDVYEEAVLACLGLG